MLKQIINKISNKKILLLSIIIFILAFTLRICGISLKQDMFVDETFTTQISNYSQYYSGISVPLDEKQILTGEDIKQEVMSLNPSIKDVINDVISLHQFTKDTPHSNLYYSLYRIWFSGYGKFELKKFITHGCTLNLIFFSFSFYYMYKLLKRLFGKESFLVPFGLFCAYLNTASISTTLFIREYALQECLFVALTYYVVKYYDFIGKNISDYGIKDVFKLATIISLTFLSGYYSTVLILLYAGLLIWRAIRLKDLDFLRFLFATAVATIYTIFLLYPGVIAVFTSYRTVETGNKILGLKNLQESFLYGLLITIKYFYCIPIIVLITYWFNKIRKNHFVTEIHPIFKKIYICALIWFVVIIFIAIYKLLRYVMPITPILMLIFPYIASFLHKKKSYITVLIFIYLTNLFLAFSGYIGINIRSYIPFAAKIDFITNYNHSNFLFKKDINLPVFIIQDGLQGPTASYIFLEDKQKYYITNETPKIFPYKHFYTIRYIVDSFSKPADLAPIYQRVGEPKKCDDFYVCEEYVLKDGNY